MSRLLNFITGAGIGAGLTYLFDPNQGNRRRALLRDQVIHAIAKANAGADAAWRDFMHRSYGTVAELRGTLGRGEAPDDVLSARVRAKMGHFVSHPAAIEVAAHDGHVTVSGPILTHEAPHMLAAIRSVRGVRDIEDHLDRHDTAENVSALQGGVPRTGQPPEMMQQYWTPATRLGAAALGCAMMTQCLQRRGPVSMLVGTVGFGLFLRALTNLEMKRLFGFGGGRRGIDVAKAIFIERPVEDVFSLLSDPTNYPRFSDVVLSTEDLGGGQYRKMVRGPGGMKIVLEETITRSVPNEFIAWRSESGSMIQYAGRARFERVNDSRTRVEVYATYNPPGGVLSDAAAHLARYDLKSQLEDLLLRAKSYLETGVQPHDAAERKLAEAHQSAGG